MGLVTGVVRVVIVVHVVGVVGVVDVVGVIGVVRVVDVVDVVGVISVFGVVNVVWVCPEPQMKFKHDTSVQSVSICVNLWLNIFTGSLDHRITGSLNHNFRVPGALSAFVFKSVLIRFICDHLWSDFPASLRAAIFRANPSDPCPSVFHFTGSPDHRITESQKKSTWCYSRFFNFAWT